MNKLSLRSLKILKSLIEHYIQDGHPVSSNTLAQESSIKLSPATIRHIMSELEEEGYLKSPHTSAGRIPTVLGYRLFVDNFITLNPSSEDNFQSMRQYLGFEKEAQVLIHNASKMLSNISQLVGVVTIPKHDQLLLKLVEFLPLSKNQVLVVFVFNEQDVQNRVIETKRAYTPHELEVAGNFLTTHFAGKDLMTARSELFRLLRKDHHELDQMLQAVMEIAEQTLETEEEGDYVIAGETNLFNAVEESDYQKLRYLFRAFEKKRDILHLLDQAVNATGIQIFIGDELGHDFDDFSFITSPYTQNDRVIGVLGVIGPTRMRYHKIVSVVDITAKLLSQSLDIR